MRTSAIAAEPNLSNLQALQPVERALRSLLGDSRFLELPDASVLNGKGSALPDVLVSWSRSNDVEVELQKRGYIHQHRFAVLPSRLRARWLLPQRSGPSAVDGFEVYTPFSPGARFMKTLLTQIRATGWQGWARHTVLIASKKPLAFETLVQNVTGETQLAFALSIGTPGLFQKLTIQVMSADGKILCYAKLPLTNGASRRLVHEARLLQELQRFPSLRSRVPHLLYDGAWSDGHVLIQTKLPGKPGPTRFSSVHDDFLQVLQECKPSMVPGRAVVRGVSREWGRVAPQMGSRLQNLGRDALRIATRELDAAQVLCGISHGDFAPWNTRMHRNNLFLFDWESASLDAPCVWDRFHFLAQAESLLGVKHSPSDSADPRLENRSLYLLYLLHSMAQLADEQPAEPVLAYRERELSQHMSESSAAAD